MSEYTFNNKKYPCKPDNILMDILKILALDSKDDKTFVVLDSVRELIWNYSSELWKDMDADYRKSYAAQFKVYEWTIYVNRTEWMYIESQIFGTKHRLLEEINKRLDRFGVNDNSEIHFEEIYSENGLPGVRGSCDSEKYHIEIFAKEYRGTVTINLK